VAYDEDEHRGFIRVRALALALTVAAAVFLIVAIGLIAVVPSALTVRRRDANFGSSDKTYGSLGGVVVLLLWLYITALVVVLGAEINAALESQTARDSTTGREQPLGQRGAEVADSIPTPG
jgi:membrane protein